MANIDRIVKVYISLRTTAIAQQNFNDLLLYGMWTPVGAEKVAIITSPDELIDTYHVQPTDSIYKAAEVAFSQIPHLGRIFIGLDSNAPSTDLPAIKAENNDWYAICDTKHDESRALAIGQWTEANEKLFVTALHSANNASAPGTDTTSIAHVLMQNNLFRTAWWYVEDVEDFTDVAITVKSFTKYPGQETWANQRLAGVPYYKLSETSAQNIFAKNGNTFEPFRNISITQQGKVAGGEWIDVIRFRDWLCEEIKIRIFQQMVDNRIPYTDPGIAIIRSRLQEALDFGVFRGGIAPPEINNDGDYVPSYVIQVPLSTNVSTNDKANRILRDVYFTARLAGAIHVVEIQGVLTYENLPVASPNSAVNVAARAERVRASQAAVSVMV